MSITVAPSSTFTAVAINAPTGLAGTIGVRILDDDDEGATVIARTTAGIVEAPSASGTYIATLTAPAVAGDYLVYWDTGVVSSATTTTEELVVTDAPAWTPTVDDVGALLHARTNVDGEELGTFTDATRPTGDQVEALITLAVGDVISRVGVTVPARYAGDAKRLATLQAATLVEASYFPEQLDTDHSAYRQYSAAYLSGVEQLGVVARQPGALRLA